MQKNYVEINVAITNVLFLCKFVKLIFNVHILLLIFILGTLSFINQFYFCLTSTPVFSSHWTLFGLPIQNIRHYYSSEENYQINDA